LPGVGGRQWHWKGQPPLYWTFLFVFFFVIDIAWIGLDFVIPYFAAQSADPVRSQGIRISGNVYYVRPWIGWFQHNGEWLFLPLLFLLFLIMFVKRDEVERVR
jgi:hypothetical protein